MGASLRRMGQSISGKSRTVRWLEPRRLGITLAGLAAVAALGATLVSCGGGGPGRTGGSGIGVPQNLSASQVQTVILQAAHEASARGTPATIAVVDRVGNVLGVMQMSGAPTTVTVTSSPRVVTPSSGLEGLSGIPSTLAAISKAITGAYLSSNGNAFTTRTASQIIQENFNPGTNDAPGGPLFGTQFSSLPCSDLVTDDTSGSGLFAGAPGPGPHRAPLGLSADPGGLPLYINGTLVGGIGVEANGIYGLSAFPSNGFDVEGEELIAIAGQTGFTPPAFITANNLSVGGLTLRYTDSDSSELATAVQATGTYSPISVTGYYTAATTLAGTTFLTPASGYISDPSGLYPGLPYSAVVLVNNAGAVRFTPTAGTVPAGNALTATEVDNLIIQGLSVAYNARAAIRQPLNSFVQVTVSVVDLNGNVLGVARTPDAALFGTDVSLQKARSAVFFSNPAASAAITGASASVAGYVSNSTTFLGQPAFTGGIAWSERALGNISRPFYPDGINGNANGPLSRPFAQWSVFTTGLQTDLVGGNILAQANGSAATAQQCGGAAAFSGAGGLPSVGNGLQTALANGLQIFAGGVPIYRGGVLIGGFGVSGDGIDQDDMVSFLGLAHAGGTIGNAPMGIRADTLNPLGDGNLRYVNCPFQPFLDSDAQNVCAGL